MANWFRSSFALFSAAALLFMVAAESAFAQPLTRALWVFTDEISAASNRQTLVSRSVRAGVTDLYVSIYRSTLNSAGRRMVEDADLAALISQAHGNNMRVWAAYGAPDWPTGGRSFALDRMAEVVSYNTANPAALLDGVMLDVEPPEPQSAADYRALLSFYQAVSDVLRPAGVWTGAAIRFFWDAPVDYPEGCDSKPAYQHIIDLDLAQVVVMGYRDFAESPDHQDGIIPLIRDEVNYAEEMGKYGMVLSGVETGDVSPDRITFFQEGQDYMDAELRKVATEFTQSGGFGGFAIDMYGAAYLSGLPGWPIPERFETSLSAADALGTPGQAVTLTATLTRSIDSVPLAGRTVSFSVGGAASGSAVANGAGVATLAYTIPAKPAAARNLLVHASFAGDTDDNPSTGDSVLSVRLPSGIALPDVLSTYASPAKIKATLRSGTKAVAGVPIAFLVEGAGIGSVTTSASGVALLTLPTTLPGGEYRLTALFAGDSSYMPARADAKWTVLRAPTTLTVFPIAGKRGATVILRATLRSGQTPLPDLPLDFEVDGKPIFTIQTDLVGSANGSFTLNLAPGRHTITVRFRGNPYYLPSNGIGVLTVK